MLNTDAGIQGAKRQSWRANSPRALVVYLREKFPQDSAEAIQERFIALVARDKDLMRTSLIYHYTNILLALDREQRRIGDDVQSEHAEERRESREAEIDAFVVKAKRIILLDMPMPNGKPLRDCTGKECRRFSKDFARDSGLLGRIAGQVKPNEIVGAVLTEEQAQKLRRK